GGDAGRPDEAARHGARAQHLAPGGVQKIREKPVDKPVSHVWPGAGLLSSQGGACQVSESDEGNAGF
ncbi:MAG TPA: hypothetical protein VN038_00230, partial [Dyadobacter sp.]|nr:hypothetical protein [Dyadobacter sp.]